ncbi:MAG: 16S rRNA (guanine(527)-N(7))-methyltransferase RsmG [Gammaproteobacteria bacterium]|nr:16S rRNA (guanine(527)-N(7))-methyltransferase RsmG [Gammaproteobacteria bacterium]MBU1624582.1 16S rRNA (guanine(527)-N(7))-methyltransferase RsmG [Gammaproteobacteria bacterium]MBU1982426.1 16S rRNA (guanine(527)-N(7))-methyltransferase RsmG [Gammaproteobacteria bacterium]
MQSERQTLTSGAGLLGIELTADAQSKLLEYMALMQKWNKVYNLTAISSGPEMVTHHLLDSLAVLPHLWTGKWLDVGCGGGLPGVVLAIMRPDWEFTLLDSNSKKTGFVQQVAIQLGLKNVQVHTGRVEDWQESARFDGIISRAFTEIGNFFRLTEGLLAPEGRWAAMKGKMEEAIPLQYRIDQIITLQVPGLDASRSLVIAGRK